MSDAPIVAITDTSITYRASAIGSCLRKLWFARNGYTPKPSTPPQTRIAFAQGHLLEAGILQQLENQGWKLYNRQAQIKFEVGRILDRTVYVIGHVDAIGAYQGEMSVVDAKALADSSDSRLLTEGLEAFPHYVWQQSAYCVGAGVNSFCLAIYNKDTKKFRAVRYMTPPRTKSQICDRIMSVELATEPPPCTNDFPCEFFHLHDAPEKGVLTPNQLELVGKYNDLRTKLDNLRTLQVAVADELLADLPYTDSERSFAGDGYSVTVTNNPKRLDQKKVKELLEKAKLDISTYYTPGEGVHLRVTKGSNATSPSSDS
jgi:hypothetical protein